MACLCSGPNWEICPFLAVGADVVRRFRVECADSVLVVRIFEDLCGFVIEILRFFRLIMVARRLLGFVMNTQKRWN